MVNRKHLWRTADESSLMLHTLACPIFDQYTIEKWRSEEKGVRKECRSRTFT